MSPRSRIGRALLVAASLGTVAAPAAAQSLGRLFTTPDQRRQLDQARIDAELAPKVEPEAKKKTVKKGPVVDQLTINGIVLRSGGPNSAWINGGPVLEGAATREGIRVEPEGKKGDERLRIKLPSGVDTVELKPGQKIDVLTGKVLDAYQYKPSESASSAFEAGSLEKALPKEQPDAIGGNGGAAPAAGAAAGATPAPSAGPVAAPPAPTPPGTVPKPTVPRAGG